MDLLSPNVSGGHMVSKNQVPLPLYQPGWYQQSPRRELQLLGPYPHSHEQRLSGNLVGRRRPYGSFIPSQCQWRPQGEQKSRAPPSVSYQQSRRRELQFLSQQAVTGFPSTSPEYHWKLSGEPALLFAHSSNEVVTTSPISMMPEQTYQKKRCK